MYFFLHILHRTLLAMVGEVVLVVGLVPFWYEDTGAGDDLWEVDVMAVMVEVLEAMVHGN